LVKFSTDMAVNLKYVTRDYLRHGNSLQDQENDGIRKPSPLRGSSRCEILPLRVTVPPKYFQLILDPRAQSCEQSMYRRENSPDSAALQIISTRHPGFKRTGSHHLRAKTAVFCRRAPAKAVKWRPWRNRCTTPNFGGTHAR